MYDPEHIISKEIGKFIKNRTEKEKQPQKPIEQQATVEKAEKIHITNLFQ